MGHQGTTLQPTLCRAQQALLLERGCVYQVRDLRVGQSLANQRDKEHWQGSGKPKTMEEKARQWATGYVRKSQTLMDGDEGGQLQARDEGS